MNYREKYENAVADYETTMFEKEQLKKQLEEYQKALDKTMSEKIDIQNNWNKLRDYVLKKQAILFDTEYTCYSNILDKMEELEKGDSNEKRNNKGIKTIDKQSV